jgi:5'-nucleotidase
MDRKPLILVTNDDSIKAPGLRKLIEIMQKLGEVVVIASEQVMSGMAHAVTIQTPLMPRLLKDRAGYKEYVTNGTPTDNVKLGKHRLLNRTPDLVVSGINHGSNASINIIYSGTMAAVLEAAIDGIPAIGFSLLDYMPDADFSHVEEWVMKITKKVIDDGLPEGVCLNVNIPRISEQPIKGIKVCRQAKARWVEEFEERKDPYGRTYYWLGGRFMNGDKRSNTDEQALSQNFISVVPVQFDFTAHEHIEALKFD